MARAFDNASSQYLEINSAPVTAYPFTMACWVYSDDLTIGQSAIWIGDKDSSGQYHSLLVRGNVAGDPIGAASIIAGVGVANTSTGISANTWHHACGVFTDATNRAAFIDGGSKGTNAISKTPAGLDRISIGRFADNSPSAYFSGNIAEAAVWNVALTDAEVAILAKGYSPFLVRPQNLVFYVPAIRDNDKDLIGGLSLTAFNSPTIVVHPKIFYPTGGNILKVV